MFDITTLITGFFISLVTTLMITVPIKKLAIYLKFVDHPNYRKLHTGIKPRMGGLGIFIGMLMGLWYFQPSHIYFTPIMIGACVITATGLADDRFQIRPTWKLTGQIIAASVPILSGLMIDKITIPFLGITELGYLSVPITFLWIIGVTNAINLIDGLDGLAAGVSTIALITITTLAVMDYRVTVVYICIALIGSNLGFLFHNFYPAKIYMGDTGALLLGYMISIVSMMGLFKNATLFSFVIPVVVLGVPIFDTLFAIVRRKLNGQSIVSPDNKHIHYRLLQAGFSHRTTVLIIYAFSVVLGALAIIFSNSALTVTIIGVFILLLAIHILAELAGLVFNGTRPLLDSINRVWCNVKKKKVDER
ncbi:glycosyltransferase family 4 protein [Pontibacillus litoralis]|uniref:UDP-phosphate N-acetylglucosaminyl 1-phosphate transferase n=1 Tax=Pontibacillus litoralis JSM 072002 TaxID=1385512 RepID=A0A0A5G5E0_9BACI|nr:MraY family glycosyltransferase [Pontibacillus litoralis]KGX86378.1 UDP-phosphate N-acetylglucosaminyl 1-phosphate transferase [Pontibacillus litoralis JSM 072002]